MTGSGQSTNNLKQSMNISGPFGKNLKKLSSPVPENQIRDLKVRGAEFQSRLNPQYPEIFLEIWKGNF